MERNLIGSHAMLYVMAIGLSAYSAFADAEQKVRQDAPDRMKGKKIFVKYCSGCHGSLGQGNGYRILGPSPPDFTSLASRQKSDADLLKTIHEGKPNMPAWKFRLSQKDSRDVLAYIRTLADDD
jgi:mono/diheme cytochrome c family protein